MNQTKPSAGALRAAVEICEDGRWDEQVIAHIIDRETGLQSFAELLEAAKRVSRFFVYLESIKGEGARDSLNQLRQAIAKAEQA